MAGIEKITDQIIAKAQSEADAIIREAQSRAADICDKANADAGRKVAEINDKSERDIKTFNERVRSAEDLNRRRTVLSAKQQIITELLDEVYEKLAKLDDGKYFDMLVTLVKQNAQAESGKIALSAKDLARIPADFEAKANAAAAKKGGSLTLCDKAADIDNGFVLIYGDIEENCSLRAIFDAGKDELTDLVHGKLS